MIDGGTIQVGSSSAIVDLYGDGEVMIPVIP